MDQYNSASKVPKELVDMLLTAVEMEGKKGLKRAAREPLSHPLNEPKPSQVLDVLGRGVAVGLERPAKQSGRHEGCRQADQDLGPAALRHRILRRHSEATAPRVHATRMSRRSTDQAGCWSGRAGSCQLARMIWGSTIINSQA